MALIHRAIAAMRRMVAPDVRIPPIVSAKIGAS